MCQHSTHFHVTIDGLNPEDEKWLTENAEKVPTPLSLLATVLPCPTTSLGELGIDTFISTDDGSPYKTWSAVPGKALEPGEEPDMQALIAFLQRYMVDCPTAPPFVAFSWAVGCSENLRDHHSAGVVVVKPHDYVHEIVGDTLRALIDKVAPSTRTEFPSDKVIRAAAEEQYAEDGVEFDLGALVSVGYDSGAYVQAWVWVDTEICDECENPVAVSLFRNSVIDQAHKESCSLHPSAVVKE